MSNLKVWQKMALMGAVFMIPFAVVGYAMVSSINTLGVEVARAELRGLEYSRPVMALVRDLQAHRGSSNALLLGDASFREAVAASGQAVEQDLKNVDEVARRFDGDFHTAKQWAAARTAGADLLVKSLRLSAEENFDRHSRLIADVMDLIGQVADASHLSQDPDAASGHLVGVLMAQGAELSEALASARGYGVGLAVSRNRTAGQLAQLNRDSTLVEVLAAKVDRSIEKAIESTPSLKAQLDAPATAASNAVLDGMSEIVKLSTSKVGESNANHYHAALTRSVDSVFQLQAKIAESLGASLVSRVTVLRREMMVTLSLAALGLLVVLAVGTFLMRDVTSSLSRVVAVANSIAIGDLPEMKETRARKDEIGVLAQAFDRMVGALWEMAQMAEQIAAGNLAVSIKPRSERDIMGHALIDMAQRLSTLVGEVQQSGIQVNASVNQIAATSKQQQATATEIAATTIQIGATSKEISATSKELVRTMSDVSDIADQSALLAGSGQSGLTRMEETMGRVMDAAGSINAKLAVLNQKATNINQVVTTITKVADQTNLLSLNAAIEAEKAGEYGRGFAVVATEIRRLADQTAVATYDIDQMVKEIQSAVTAGVMGMDKFAEEVRRGMNDVQQVGEQLSQIIQYVQTLAPRFESVNEGMQAQATGAEQITQALAQLGDAAQQTVESLRQSTQAIDGLNETAAAMRTGVSRFKLAAA